MRLSTVCELLLIFLIIAFGAYGRVIERNGDKPRQIAKSLNNDKNIGVSLMSLKDATENVNKYCQCDGIECTCCRAFPLIGINILKNEGCAVLKYVENNSLKVQLKYGGRELATRVIKGKSPAPICIPLPGGFSDFCAKVYSIKREENNQFKACLGLELKSGGDVEAAVRVSCFRFGQEGIKQLPAEDFPIIATSPKPAADDDDDYFSFVDDDDDDDDDDEDDDDEDSDDSEAPVKDNVETPQKPDTDEDEDDDDEDDDDDLGLGDISEIFDFFTGGDDNKKKPSSTTTTSPFIISTVTKQPAVSAPSSTSTANNKKPVITTSTSSTTKTTTTQQPPKATTNKPDKKQDNKTEKIPDKKQETITEKIPEKTPEITTEIALETTTVHQDNDITTEQTFDNTTPKEVGDGLVTEESSTTDTSNPTESTLETTTFISEKIEEKPIKGSESVVDIVTAKPEIPAMVVKKIILGTHKKASAGSSNLNKIENDKQKPLIKPTKADSTPVQQVTPTNNNDIIDLGELVGLTDDEETESIEDNDDDDDEENEDKSNEEEKDENVEVGETNKPDNDDDDEEEADILDSLDDDSEEQEVNAAINAIVGTDNNKNKNNNNNKIKINDKISDKVADNMASKPEDDDADYGMNLAEFMARGRHINHGRSRQSKVMRL
ncbi:bromodomain adjacent to zinc finger domain protein 2B-like isoform X2 [Aphidius gifuensis]|nr:bromodomain adjacent to zinc finger domain protein 2B-like isoform X2 [Aphidius gifuensis]XP_044008460.1 bromodomain adjacent to zinc finger domain protein 2B-like isoform X2 [Aphidius gifuensis]